MQHVGNSSPQHRDFWIVVRPGSQKKTANTAGVQPPWSQNTTVFRAKTPEIALVFLQVPNINRTNATLQNPYAGKARSKSLSKIDRIRSTVSKKKLPTAKKVKGVSSCFFHQTPVHRDAILRFALQEPVLYESLALPCAGFHKIVDPFCPEKVTLEDVTTWGSAAACASASLFWYCSSTLRHMLTNLRRELVLRVPSFSWTSTLTFSRAYCRYLLIEVEVSLVDAKQLVIWRTVENWLSCVAIGNIHVEVNGIWMILNGCLLPVPFSHLKGSMGARLG